MFPTTFPGFVSPRGFREVAHPFTGPTRQWKVIVLLRANENWKGRCTASSKAQLSLSCGSAVTFLGLILLIALLIFMPLPVQADSDTNYSAGNAVSPFVSVSRIVRPGVVNIRIIRSVNDAGVGTSPLQEMYRQYFPDEEGKGGRFEMPSTGSGFIVSGNGDILTNNHVIDGADEIFVRFSQEKKEYRAELIGTDPNTDIALIRIDPGKRILPVLEFGNSDDLEVGAWAIAVGNPFGHLESSLTVGVVSAKGRGGLHIGGQSPRYQNFIQTDASINFGNSGGPLVDVQGRVIGINTAINTSGQGLGFAVPSNMVVKLYKQLRENGRVVRGYLGVSTEDLVQVYGEEVEGEPDAGAKVLSVLAGGPAAKAGIMVGDIIVSLDDQTVDSNRRLMFLIADALPGKNIKCEIIRGGNRKGFQVLPVEWINGGPDGVVMEATLWLGLDLASVSDNGQRVKRLLEALGVTATTGVIVVEVQADSPAEGAGIRPGDVIISIDGREILDLESYNQVRNLFAERRDPISVLIRTGSVENYVLVQPRENGVEN